MQLQDVDKVSQVRNNIPSIIIFYSYSPLLLKVPKNFIAQSYLILYIYIIIT
jgi:hypothetical protein